MQNAVINVNGEILTPDRAKVSVFDRSYMYGDSLYEVVRTYGENFFLLDDHLKRLEKSAALCHMVLGQTAEMYKREIHKTLKAFRAQKGFEKTDVYMRLIVSRGLGKIGFGLSNLTTATQFTVIVQPVETPTAEQFKRGFHFQISARLRNDPRALDPAMKSGNYLNSLLAYLEAAQEEYDDALMCNADGHLTEGTTFNIAYVRRGIIATPPLDIGILEGVTRRVMIKVAGDLRIPVREVRFPKERLFGADEVFMTSSLKEVFPVTKIDRKPIADGTAGPITLKLAAAYKKELARILG